MVRVYPYMNSVYPYIDFKIYLYIYLKMSAESDSMLRNCRPYQFGSMCVLIDWKSATGIMG